MTPEEVLEGYHNWANRDGKIFMDLPEVIEAMKEYGRKERDKALDWAVAHATASHVWDNAIYDVEILVDEDSILSGKTHPDLSI